MNYTPELDLVGIDKRFNILSYDQYLTDLNEKKFTKMCMTEVVNADMMIAIYGEEDYYRTSTEILQMGNAAYKQIGIDNLIHVYIHSYKTFMAVANDDISDEDFLNLMRANYEQYTLISSRNTGLGGVSRFVMCFGDDMINRAKSAFYMNRDTQNNFIIATNEKELLAEQTEKTLEIYKLLHYAIENAKVDVFYQGIRDNKTGDIHKYEALMRVYDENGRTCPPGMFLNEAKQLKLYLKLSEIVIDKALTAFAGKESTVSINISLYDILSESFRNWFYDRIRRHPDPSKVVVEFVETENYNDSNDLVDFLQEVRNLGCQVAIDDFGSGFATYSSIIEFKPDIIKVDACIIKNLTTSDESVVILDSICYMAKLTGSKITAEFVENQEIQDKIEEMGIEFSQGYLYAKPEPITNLNII